MSNSFPLPNQPHDDDEKSTKSLGNPQTHGVARGSLTTQPLARYQASMLRSLKEVQSDDSVVGFYQATTLGAFFNQTLVETQAIHQDKLRHGGVIIVHGKRDPVINSVVLTHCCH